MQEVENPSNNEAPKPSVLKKILGISLRLGVSGGIIFYIFWKMQREKIESLGGRSELDVFWEQLTGANLGWIAATIGCFGLTCCMGIVRWHLLLGVQGLKLGLVRTGQIFFVGQFFNSFMLGGTGGDVIKATYAAKETHSKKAEVVMTVFLDRLIGMIGLVATTFIMIAFNWQFAIRKEVLPYTATVGGLLVVIIVAFIVAVIPGAGRGIPLAEKFLKKFKLYEQVEKMVRAYRVYTGHKAVVAWALLLSLGIHFTLILVGLCLAQAVNMNWSEVSVGKYFLLVPIINCVTALPITIAGLGLREKMYMDLFKLAAPVGVTEEVLRAIGTKAVAMSLLTYGALLFWSLFGAIVFLAYKHRAHHERLE